MLIENSILPAHLFMGIFKTEFVFSVGMLDELFVDVMLLFVDVGRIVGAPDDDRFHRLFGQNKDKKN